MECLPLHVKQSTENQQIMIHLQTTYTAVPNTQQDLSQMIAICPSSLSSSVFLFLKRVHKRIQVPPLYYVIYVPSCIGDLSRFWLSCLGTLVLLLPKL